MFDTEIMVNQQPGIHLCNIQDLVSNKACLSISYDVASGTDIMSCIKINKPCMVYLIKLINGSQISCVHVYSILLKF